MNFIAKYESRFHQSFVKQIIINNWQLTLYIILTLHRILLIILLSLRANPGEDSVSLSNYGKK